MDLMLTLQMLQWLIEQSQHHPFHCLPEKYYYRESKSLHKHYVTLLLPLPSLAVFGNAPGALLAVDLPEPEAPPPGLPPFNIRIIY
jgi:hypothetical protein